MQTQPWTMLLMMLAGWLNEGRLHKPPAILEHAAIDFGAVTALSLKFCPYKRPLLPENTTVKV